MAKIAQFAVVSPTAELAADVEVGPFCVIEDGVTIGPGCRLASHVVIKQGTTLGTNNTLHEGVILGALAQHAHAPENPGPLVIGNHNTLREHVTVHRALAADQSTVIGDHNLLMVGTHVAHDCVVGNHVIMANNAALSGHVEVADRAFISGLVGVHQFCRIGRMAMIGGLARVAQDVPPFVMIDGDTGRVVGLNVVGLRRGGYTAEQISQLKQAYRLIFRSGILWAEILQRLQNEFTEGPAAEFHSFLSQSKRGFVHERRAPAAATLRIDESKSETEAEKVLRVRAG